MYTVEGICLENLQAVFYSFIKTKHAFKPFCVFWFADKKLLY